MGRVSAAAGALSIVAGLALLGAPVADAESTRTATASIAAQSPATAQVSVTRVSRAALGRSWARGCPVSPGELRRVRVNYWDLGGHVRRGAVMVHADAADGAARILSGLYDARWRIERLEPLSTYGNDMFAAQRAGATFAFGCSKRSDGTWHPHSLGRTIALNPRQNPLVTAAGDVRPTRSRGYLDRDTVRPGMLVAGSPATRAVKAAGWTFARIERVSYGRVSAPVPRDARPRVERVSRADLPYSYRSGCPVTPSGLRRVLVYHWGFDGKLQRGELIVRSSAVRPLSRVFSEAYAARFPIRAMHRVDEWRANDQRAMAADNTSAFNCRKVTGNPYRLSQHSYGNAIDINTFENPYVTSSRVYPPGSGRYLDRSPYRKGMIVSSGPVAEAFRALGWPWGARWRNPDYQHFSSNGG